MALQQVHTCVRVRDIDAYAALLLRARIRGARPAELRLGLQRLHGPARRRRHDGVHRQRRPGRALRPRHGLQPRRRHGRRHRRRAGPRSRSWACEPEKPPYRPGGRDELPNIAFVADPDGYRVELIDGGPLRHAAGRAAPVDRAVTFVRPVDRLIRCDRARSRAGVRGERGAPWPRPRPRGGGRHRRPRPHRDGARDVPAPVVPRRPVRALRARRSSAPPARTSASARSSTRACATSTSPAARRSPS